MLKHHPTVYLGFHLPHLTRRVIQTVPKGYRRSLQEAIDYMTSQFPKRPDMDSEEFLRVYEEVLQKMGEDLCETYPRAKKHIKKFIKEEVEYARRRTKAFDKSFERPDR